MCEYSDLLLQQTNKIVEINNKYKFLFISIQFDKSSSQTTVSLRHYSDNSTLDIEYYKFLSIYSNQTCVLQQNLSEQHYAETTIYCLKNPKVDILLYIKSCVASVLRKACTDRHSVTVFFQLVQIYKNVSNLSICRLQTDLLRFRLSNNIQRYIQLSIL